MKDSNGWESGKMLDFNKSLMTDLHSLTPRQFAGWLQRLDDEWLGWFIQHLRDQHQAHCPRRWSKKRQRMVPVSGSFRNAYLAATLAWKARNITAAVFAPNERITKGGAAALRAALLDKALLGRSPRYATPKLDVSCYGSGNAGWKMLHGAVAAPPVREWRGYKPEKVRWWEKTVGAQKDRS